MDVIVSHVNADFDSLGAAVGACRLYPGATAVLPGGDSPGVRDFLSLHRDALEVARPPDIDPEAITRVVVVDTCHRRRLGPAGAWLDLPGVEVHLYDHHAGSQPDFRVDQLLLRPTGAVCTLVAERLREFGRAPIPVEATALLLGIYEDTGSLTFAGTTPEDLEAAAWLLRQGAELEMVRQFAQRALSSEQRQLLRQLMETLEVVDVRGASVALASAAGPHVEDAAVLVRRVMDAEEAAVGVVLLDVPGGVTVIARSAVDAVDVGAALRDLGGGGHPRAASAVVREPLAEARTKVLDALERHFRAECTAREVMSYPVRTITPEASIAEARRRMIRYGHSGLVVMEGKRLVGVVTRRDVDKARHHQLEHAPVRGFMTKHVRTVSLNTPISELERLMISEGIGRIPVLADSGVVGVVTRSDVLRALHGARYLSGTQSMPEESPAELVRERLPATVQRILADVGEVARRLDAHAYVVGGFVRDLLLGVKNLDIDILAEPDGIALAEAYGEAAGGTIKREERFGTAHVVLPTAYSVDFATARTEAYAHPGALPDVEPSSVVDDLRRRDFTVNAMALSLRPEQFGELLDPFGGREDLAARRLRILHSLSFVEDPTRLFRAVRFEARFHFQMDPNTEAFARELASTGGLGHISPDRLRRDLFGIFHERGVVGSLLRLQDLGVLAWLAPALRVDAPLVGAVAGAVAWWKKLGAEAESPDTVYLAALLAPLGLSGAARVSSERLCLPPPTEQRLLAALRGAEAGRALVPGSRPSQVAAVLRPLSVEALVLLHALCQTGALADEVRELLERFALEWRNTRLEISGDDLKALGYRPGPALGEALSRTLAARLDGEVAGAEAELAFARRVMDEVDRDDRAGR